MERCPNKVCYFISSGYGYKEVSLPCGTTGREGQCLLCDQCADQAEEDFPQGWRDAPGDVCVHGCYVGNTNGPDYICGECEAL